jgi:hypothetical protein
MWMKLELELKGEDRKSDGWRCYRELAGRGTPRSGSVS